MAMGGFHIHSRASLDTPYRGEEFMGHVKASVEAAKAKGLLTCLYDEDRWPSGAAGGLVVADNPEFKAVHLLLTKRKYGSLNLPPPLQGANGQARRSELGSLIARYDLHRGDDGLVTSFKRAPVNLTLEDNVKHVPWTEYRLLQSLEVYRDVRIIGKDNGDVISSMLHQLRRDGAKDWDQGPLEPNSLDTIIGERNAALVSRISNGWTWLEWHFEACGSLLVELSPYTDQPTVIGTPQEVFRADWTTVAQVDIDHVELSEPNILLLDYASCSTNGNAWELETEILRIDNIMRERLGLPLKREAYRQPWAIPGRERESKAEIKLRYHFTSQTAIHSAKIAAEFQQGTTVLFDDQQVPVEYSGWWVDEDIRTIDLPFIITPGTHTLELRLPCGLLTNLERVYLLGEFGVRVRGKACFLEPLNTSKIAFGDWTKQVLPFYAGNLTHVFRGAIKTCNAQRVVLHIPHFAGPVIVVYLNGKRRGTVALQPNTVDLGVLEPGQEFELRLECYGNRENSFGTLHMPDDVSRWFAPNAWRTEDDWWIEGYNVKPMGVFQDPGERNLESPS